MTDKLLVSVAANQVSAARWLGGRLGECTVFENSEDGHAAFSGFLARAPAATAHFIVDAVEEDYRFESLPHSFGSDRNEMIARKLKQHYRNSPYCSAHIQGRDSGKRRDDRYLFCALTNPELINSWLQAVTERGLPVAGIYLLPTVSAKLIEKLKLKQANLLVVSVHGAGLRLSFFREQQLRISRLARIAGGARESIKNYAEEISNTRLYLHALRVMTLDEHLSVLIVDQNDKLKDLAQAISQDNANVECHLFSRQEIVRRLGVAAQSLDSSNDALYLHLLGLSPPANNLAPANVTLSYRQRRIRRGVYALAGAAALAVASWCAFTLFQIFDTRADIDSTRRETAGLESQYQEATRQFPAAPTSAENLRRAVEISQKIGATTRTPEIVMDLVSRTLDQHPSIIVKSFGWRYDGSEYDVGHEGGAAAAAAPPVAAAPTVQPGTKRKESALIEGEVRPFHGDYRAAIAAINRFREELLHQPNVAEVQVVKQPLNISPNLTLTGNTADSREQSDKAEFKILLVMRPAA